MVWTVSWAAGRPLAQAGIAAGLWPSEIEGATESIFQFIDYLPLFVEGSESPDDGYYELLPLDSACLSFDNSRMFYWSTRLQECVRGA